jgi:epsilon-lactone hydrolase
MSKTQLLNILNAAARNPAPQSPDPLVLRLWFNAAFSQVSRPENVTTEKVQIGEFSAEIVTPLQKTGNGLVIYFHGGGFIFGNLVTHKVIAAGIAEASGLKVLHVDYRLAPEHKFPCAHEDAVTAYEWALTQYEAEQIGLCGDSAGGNLALATAVSARNANKPLPSCMGFLSSYLDLACEGESHSKIKDDPVLSGQILEFFNICYAGDTDRHSPFLSPFYDELSKLPPALFHVGTWEILHDDTINAAKKIVAAGGLAEVKIWDGMCHSMQLFAPFLDEATASIKEMGMFFKEHIIK